jgi:hypothetical protein
MVCEAAIGARLAPAQEIGFMSRRWLKSTTKTRPAATGGTNG